MRKDLLQNVNHPLLVHYEECEDDQLPRWHIPWEFDSNFIEAFLEWEAAMRLLD